MSKPPKQRMNATVSTDFNVTGAELVTEGGHCPNKTETNQSRTKTKQNKTKQNKTKQNKAKQR